MSRCLICHEVINRPITWSSLILNKAESLVCSDCEVRFDRIMGETCSICSRVLDEPFRKGNTCLDCYRWEKDEEWTGHLNKNTSIFHYNGFMKEVMAKYKYRGDYALAEVFAFYMKERILQLDYDLITFIPLSNERLKERGFNQAQALLDVSNIGYHPLLSRIHTEKQSKKSRQERISLSQIFQITDKVILKEKKIVIMDDIYTTGSTLRHAAKALKLAGAFQVQTMTIAR